MKVCQDCPFLRVGHVELHPLDAEAFGEWVKREVNFPVCHSDRKQEAVCKGAMQFRANQEKKGAHPKVFDTTDDMIDANKKNEKLALQPSPVLWDLWGVDD